MLVEQPVVIHQARWVIPVEGPVIPDGAVVVAGDRIAAVGPAAAIRQEWHDNGLGADEIVFYDHGDGAIIPALVNTHLHLEYTALRGAVPPQANLPAWLQAAIEAFITLAPEEIDCGVREGLAELRRFGTILGAEVSNTGRSLPYSGRQRAWIFIIFTNAWGLTCWPRTHCQAIFPSWPGRKLLLCR